MPVEAAKSVEDNLDGKRNNQFVWHSRPKLLVQACSPSARVVYPFGEVQS